MTPLPRTLERIRTNLASPATELIGREDELSVLLDLIATAHLVTLSGPGGVGKTRLALELARRAAEDFDAVWWVALEPILDPNEVMGAVARAIGLPEVAGVEAAERVLDHLRARSVLLVLDDLEHVIDVAPLIGQVARAGPEVRVLVTSMLPLRVGGEHVLSLDPLPVPTGSERDIDALRSVPSVALLAERATTAATGTGIAWELTEPERFDDRAAVPAARRHAAGAGAGRVGPARARRGRAAPPAGRGPRCARRWRPDVPARERGLRAVMDVGGGPDCRSPSDHCCWGWRCGRRASPRRWRRRRSATSTTSSRRCWGPGWSGTAEGGRLEVPPPVRWFAAELTDAEADDAAHAAITDALIALAEPFEKRWPACWGEGRRVLHPEAGNIFAELDWAQLMDYGRHVRLAAATGWWMSQSGAGEFGRDHLEIALARSNRPGHARTVPAGARAPSASRIQTRRALWTPPTPGMTSTT